MPAYDAIKIYVIEYLDARIKGRCWWILGNCLDKRYERIIERVFRLLIANQEVAALGTRARRVDKAEVFQ